MADPTGEPILSKIHGHHSSLSSDSDIDDEPSRASAVKSDIHRLFGRQKPFHKVLGGGKYADVLLWRKKKKSSLVVCGGTVIWIVFEMLEYKFITLICHIAMLALSFFFMWSNSCSLINKPAPQIPEIQIPTKCVLEVVSVVRTQMNRGLPVARCIAKGSDLGKFLKVISVLWLVSVVGSWFSFFTFLYLMFISMHTLPALYEKYQDRVDRVAEKVVIKLRKHYVVLKRKVMSKISNRLGKDKKLRKGEEGFGDSEVMCPRSALTFG